MHDFPRNLCWEISAVCMLLLLMIDDGDGGSDGDGDGMTPICSTGISS